MFKKAERTERDIDQDVTLLADTLDEVLRESGDKTKEELKELHSKAKGVLRDARARFNGSTSLTQTCARRGRSPTAMCVTNLGRA